MPFEAEFETAQNHSEVTFSPQDFEGVSAVVVDIQDSGSRYFSCTRSVFSLMRALHQMGDEAPSLYVVDHLNPAGRCVEGTMPAGSKGGDFPKTCHRHGLSLGELCHLYQNEISFKSPLHIISALAQGSVQLLPWAIPPSVDIPGLFTCDVYSGAYLWQKTNISPALGTPRPYEYFQGTQKRIRAFYSKYQFRTYSGAGGCSVAPLYLYGFCGYVCRSGLPRLSNSFAAGL